MPFGYLDACMSGVEGQRHLHLKACMADASAVVVC